MNLSDSRMLSDQIVKDTVMSSEVAIPGKYLQISYETQNNCIWLGTCLAVRS